MAGGNLWRQIVILHADGNSFFASCEQIYRPDLRDKPVAVLSNNDGIIVALNKQAKACGLKRGDAYFKVKYICEREDVSVFSSNYTLYADISRRITSIYMEYAPQIEPYSIDESFLFFDDCKWTKKDFEEIGYELKRRVLKEVGMPICVGGAPTKTLAKLYNKNAKKHDGVFIYDSGSVDSLLEETPCGDIWGIGPARASTLRYYGIRNALQLKNMDKSRAKKLLTLPGFATVQELNGIRSIERIVRSSHDVITSSRQFGRKVYDMATLEKALVQYTQAVVEKLRKLKCEAGGVFVFLSTCNYYETDESKKYSDGIFVKFPRMTSCTSDIVKAAEKGLLALYRYGFGYKSVMITLTDLLPESFQGLLWTNPLDDIRKRSLMNTMDSLSERYGRSALVLAKGIDSKGDWQMKRRMLSPCWTTRIADIPKVK